MGKIFYAPLDVVLSDYFADHSFRNVCTDQGPRTRDGPRTKNGPGTRHEGPGTKPPGPSLLQRRERCRQTLPLHLGNQAAENRSEAPMLHPRVDVLPAIRLQERGADRPGFRVVYRAAARRREVFLSLIHI